MAGKQSAGLLLYRLREGTLEVAIVHMGGPFWAAKDEHAWSIPKGEFTDDENPLQAAKREFTEELGKALPEGELTDLGVSSNSGKRIHVWALEAELDLTEIHSNTFELEWPRGSARIQQFPEVDRAGWFDIPTAERKLVKGQLVFLERLGELIEP